MNSSLSIAITGAFVLLVTANAHAQERSSEQSLLPPEAISENIRSFIKKARDAYGVQGEKAAGFLVDSMPPGDRKTLITDFLMENLSLAFEAREKFPWAKKLPEEHFLNDVLPYAVLDETREPWRKDLFLKSADLVKECATASEAAQKLNEKLFNLLNVHYNTNRQRPNQSPGESIAQGRATCTGLAILLVDACRAVGIPARVAGTAEWTTKPGNHTWVEIWDGEWKFIGADEFDPKGFNRGWFVNDASKAIANEASHAIWASSWKPVDGRFPMVWNTADQYVGAVNVTARYTARHPDAPAGHALIHLRISEHPSPGTDARIAVTAELCDQGRHVIDTQLTKTGTADLNDTASFNIKPGAYLLRLRRGEEVRELPLTIDSTSERTLDFQWETLAPAPL